jgi:hypothetical protein
MFDQKAFVTFSRRKFLQQMGGASLALAAPCPWSAPRISPQAIRTIAFTDVTQSAGITFRHENAASPEKFLIETMGSGCGWIDYDQNGLLDLYLVNGAATRVFTPKEPVRSALYRNNGDGTFTDVTMKAGVGAEGLFGMGVAVGDYDNDGFPDLLVLGYGRCILYHNNQDGTFTDVTSRAGVQNAGLWASSAAWFDYDNDGKLDLFVSHYVDWSLETDQYCTLDGKHKSYCTPELYKGQSATLYHNKGNGTFEDVTKKAGLYDPSSKSLGVALLDYDNDGWLDLFVANDTQPNKLYHNNHNGTFTDEAFSTGVAFSDAGKARAGMGADAADYDLSGHQGLVIGNFANESMSLYQNDGSGLFTDKAMTDGIGPASASSLTFSTFFFDYDLDGLPDIFAANGHVADDVSVVTPSLHYAEPPLLFHNKGNGKFEDVTDKVGSALRQPVVGRGAAYLDFDNDGDLDLVLTTSNGPAKLLRNDNGNQNDLLKVKTIGTKSNRDGIGAEITVKTSRGLRLFGMVKDGSSYLSQSELPRTFGLGKPDADKRVSLDIVWPSGKKESVANIKPNQFITLEEGKGMISAQPIVFSAPQSQP